MSVDVGTIVTRKRGPKHVGKVEAIFQPWGRMNHPRARVMWWHAYSARPGHGRWLKTVVAVDALRASDAKWPPNLPATEVAP